MAKSILEEAEEKIKANQEGYGDPVKSWQEIATIASIRINGDLENRLPNTSSISFEFIEGESILLMLDQHGICASSGSACTTGSLEPSHVLRAMGLPYTAAHGTIRFSLSRFNTEAEIDTIVEVLPPIISRLREMSPFWDKK